MGRSSDKVPGSEAVHHSELAVITEATARISELQREEEGLWRRLGKISQSRKTELQQILRLLGMPEAQRLYPSQVTLRTSRHSRTSLRRNSTRQWDGNTFPATGEAMS